MKIKPVIHYDKKALDNHIERIKNNGGKIVLIRKLYDESLGKHYYELTYKF